MCIVWKTLSVTFNLSTKTKTLLVQGKAVDYTQDLLLQTIQAVYNQSLTAAWLAQLVECQTAVREVEGSSPRLDQHSGS